MNESFLHYIWQCQYFNKEDLKTTQGETVSIFKNGVHNTHAGPDFSNAKIKIGPIDWAGNVEIHINSSEWNQHQHNLDKAYDNVILHVVWKNDVAIKRQDGSEIPTLELRNRIDPQLIKSYQKLVNSALTIPCSKSFTSVDSLTKLSMLDKALTQRLYSKAELAVALLDSNKGDWDEMFYQLLAKNFGFKVNAEPFFQLAKAVPYKIIQKQSSLLQVEALLFGAAGMLDAKTKDKYISLLYREYQLLKAKYSLADSQLHASQWRFLRLRPANFPTLRIAQLASFLFQQRSIFSKILEAESYSALRKLFTIDQSDYWKAHYRFGKKAADVVVDLGETSVQNIVINTVAPILAAYSIAKDNQAFMDKSIRLLEGLPGEKNEITRTWNELGLPVKSAFDSQAVIEQYNNFCQHRQCLQCAVGASLLKPTNS